MFRLETPLAEVTNIGPKFLKNLERLGLKTVRDLVWHFPARYEDFSQIYNISDLEPGQEATIAGVVTKVDVRRSWRKRMVIVEAEIQDETGTIRAIWFNQPYLKNIIKIGRMMNFSGKITFSDGDLYLSHPDYELSSVSNRAETRHTARLVPIYPETRGLTSRALRFLIQPVLRNLEEIEEFLPKEILARENLPEINESIQKIHFPENLEETEAIKRRFAFQDIFLLQLWNLKQKMALAKEKAQVISADIDYLKTVIETLPFKLTDSQKKSLWEIIKNLSEAHPMNRLLQGDVGSGKTIVAALAALITYQKGFQAAFMAPTEILAGQHFKTLKKILIEFEKKYPKEKIPAVGLLVGSGAKIFMGAELEYEIPKKKILSNIASGEAQILIGTHALIQKDVDFKNLGLTIIDEQHRFGVRQRATLLKNKNGLIPHFLSMSATPIPRTLMLTIFGDLDVSLITELPKGRKPIMTKIIPPEERVKAYQFIKKQVLEGRQVFVICPRIDPPETDQPEATLRKFRIELDVRSVKEEYEKLSKKIFLGLRVGMLHGQIKPKEKEKIMHDFNNKKIDILVSTSVIEVGVDVPNATIMMIEGSERFGLAQLYQFRGRVGRGEHQSYCFLFTDSKSEATNHRLKAIVEAKNGFELAEKDLKLRGPGEFLGQGQSGLPDLAMRSLQDTEMIKSAREDAVQMIKEDPNFKKHQNIKNRLEEFSQMIHKE